MSTSIEVISALLDNEPFDPQDLANRLNDPAGRALLVEMATLRRIVQPPDATPALILPAGAPRYPWRLVAVAAALLVALGGGYLAGLRQTMPTTTGAPPPTRIVEAVPFTPTGGTP